MADLLITNYLPGCELANTFSVSADSPSPTKRKRAVPRHLSDSSEAAA